MKLALISSKINANHTRIAGFKEALLYVCNLFFYLFIYLFIYLLFDNSESFLSKFGNNFDLNTIAAVTIVTILHCINTKYKLFLESSIVIYIYINRICILIYSSLINFMASSVFFQSSVQ